MAGRNSPKRQGEAIASVSYAVSPQSETPMGRRVRRSLAQKLRFVYASSASAAKVPRSQTGLK